MKGDKEAAVTVCQMPEKAYAEVNPEVWVVPGKCGKLDMEPLQITLKPPGQVVFKKQYPLSGGKEGVTACYCVPVKGRSFGATDVSL